MTSALLPVESTKWERAMRDAMSVPDNVRSAIDAMRGIKYVATPPSFLPFLIYEYGLGELTPYVPSLYQLLNEGIRWQRVRGTPAAVATGLGWLGYTARLEEEDTRRRYWNMIQLELDRVRDTLPDLERIAGVTHLSFPLRSVFWRGFHGFDIRPVTYGESHWSGAHWSQHSGVRVGAKGPLWSFGRSYPFAHVLSRAELTALGVWIDVDPEDWADGNVGWDDFAWEDTEAEWESDLATARSQAMAGAAMAVPLLVAFYRGTEVIAYRRPRVRRFVFSRGGGCYTTPLGSFEPSTSPERFCYVEAMTDFDNGNGTVADRVALAFGLTPAEGVPPGRAWLGPDDVAGTAIPAAEQTVSIAFGESIRERVAFLLDFDGPVGADDA